MIRKLTIALLLALGVIALLLSGCGLTVSVSDRLDQFLADLNSDDRSSIYLNFHPEDTQDYAAIQNKTYPDWSLLFPLSDRPYAYENLNTVDTGNVTCRIVGKVTEYDATFVMALDGFDWQINDLYLGGALTIE